MKYTYGKSFLPWVTKVKFLNQKGLELKVKHRYEGQRRKREMVWKMLVWQMKIILQNRIQPQAHKKDSPQKDLP